MGWTIQKKRREGEEERYDNSKVSKKITQEMSKANIKKRKKQKGIFRITYTMTSFDKKNEQRKKRLGRGRQRKT